ncbi:MAG: TOBE domain-containing protein [Halobacteriales archaeon]
MDAQVTPRLRIGEAEFGPKDAALLRAVGAEGSLNAATAALGRSYSRAHDRVRDLEEAAGSLLKRERGGAGGGGSELTTNARELLARFDRLRAATGETARTPETVVEGTVVERTGDLAVVETGAGEVRARLLEPAGRSAPPADGARGTPSSGGGVQVSLRADAVTLHNPAGSPPADDTSARNRFEGVVVGIDREGGIAEVAVDVGVDPDLIAVLTAESVTRLGLSPGAAVVASFKATATRATPVGSDDDER